MEYPINEQPQESQGSLNWLWGALLIAMGAAFMMSNSFGDDLIAIIMTGGIGATFYYLYTTNKERRWPLFVAYPFFAATGIGVLSMTGLDNSDAIMGGYIMGMLSIPMLLAYKRSGKARWLIGPAVLLFIFGGVMLDEMLSGRGILSFLRPLDDFILTSYFMGAMSLPFLLAYTRTKRGRHLIFPALTVLVLGSVLIDSLFSGNFADNLMGVYFFGIVGTTFAVLYTRNKSRTWAMICAGLFYVGAAAFFVSSIAPILPILLIGGGVLLLTKNSLGDTLKAAFSQSNAAPDRPRTGPEADRAPVTGFTPLGSIQKDETKHVVKERLN